MTGLYCHIPQFKIIPSNVIEIKIRSLRGKRNIEFSYSLYISIVVVLVSSVFCCCNNAYPDVVYRANSDTVVSGVFGRLLQNISSIQIIEKEERLAFDEAISKSSPFWQAVKKEERERWLRVANKLSVNLRIGEYSNRVNALKKYIQELPEVHWCVVRVPKGYSADYFVRKNNEGRDVLVLSKIVKGMTLEVIDLDIITGEERLHKVRYPSVLINGIQKVGVATVHGGVFIDEISWDLGGFDIPDIYFRVQRNGDQEGEVFYPVYISDANDLLDGNNDDYTSIIPIFKWVLCGGSVVGSSHEEQIFVKIDDIRRIRRGGALNSVFFLDRNDIENYKRKTEFTHEEYGQLFSKNKANALKELLNLNR